MNHDLKQMLLSLILFITEFNQDKITFLLLFIRIYFIIE